MKQSAIERYISIGQMYEAGQTVVGIAGKFGMSTARIKNIIFDYFKRGYGSDENAKAFAAKRPSTGRHILNMRERWGHRPWASTIIVMKFPKFRTALDFYMACGG